MLTVNWEWMRTTPFQGKGFTVQLNRCLFCTFWGTILGNNIGTQRGKGTEVWKNLEHKTFQPAQEILGQWALELSKGFRLLIDLLNSINS